SYRDYGSPRSRGRRLVCADTTPRSRRMRCARVGLLVSPSQSEGAGNAGRPMRPRAACAGVAVERTRVIRSHRNHPAFPAQWFTTYTVLSPVIGFLATVVGGVASTDLTPASRRQDHTSSPSALASPVKRAAASTALRPPPRAPRPRRSRNAPLSGTGWLGI